MLSEADLIAKRAALRWLAQQHPEWTHQDLAETLSMSRSWVSKWRKLLRQADLADVMALHSRSRARHTPSASIASQPAVVERILEIRVAPPENAARASQGRKRSCTTSTAILRSNTPVYVCRTRRRRSGRSCARRAVSGRIVGTSPSPWSFVRKAEEVQFDLKDGSQVPADPDGKQLHVVEIANARRCGHLDLVAP
jgi:hypothetical protein